MGKPSDYKTHENTYYNRAFRAHSSYLQINKKHFNAVVFISQRLRDLFLEMMPMDIDDTQSNKPRTENPVGDTVSEVQCWKRPSGVAVICLGLLCGLLLAGIIGLFVYSRDQQARYSILGNEKDQFQSEEDHLQTHFSTLSKDRDLLHTKCKTLKDELQTNYDNLTKERDQLQKSYDKLNEERDQLQTSYNTLTKRRDQLQTSYNTLAKEKDELQTSYNTLAKEKDHLQTSYNTVTDERDQLQTIYNSLTKIKNQLQTSYNNLTKERDLLQTSYNNLINQKCPKNWKKFGCSCYYISSVKNTWNAGRQDCLNRRADLVIINSREEQAFIKALGHRSWIGLTDRDVDGTWRWVDGTPMTTSYWINGEPNGGKKENCGENKISNDDPVMAWNDQPCDHENYFICERFG
ncbi:C-type lectin domain family 4 member M-like isoform X1 [Esox lucius]|uniref:C-type lectin domain family 4 member M-like isoform X1 n=2 Tax=Esox lucius TaxID=8010 RepID=UPI00147778ED|nr:C-type lectin domain family 4 member M-like isoform X1 [Esox lucius]